MYFSRTKTTISMHLTAPSANIYTFGIYGRDFARDGQEPSERDESDDDDGAANSVKFKISIAFSCIISIFLLNFRF